MRQLLQLTFLSVLSGKRITQGTLVNEALLLGKFLGPVFYRRRDDRRNSARLTVRTLDALEERKGRNVAHLTLKLVLVELQVLEVICDGVTNDHFVVQDFLELIDNKTQKVG